MIIDTSALVAIVRREDGASTLLDALFSETCFLPAPVLVELRRVTRLDGNVPNPAVNRILHRLTLRQVTILPFSAAAAEAAIDANPRFGSGNGQGGPLNLLDLMVYGVAAVTGLPILCTGKDFAATDAVLHPASRRY